MFVIFQGVLDRLGVVTRSEHVWNPGALGSKKYLTLLVDLVVRAQA